MSDSVTRWLEKLGLGEHAEAFVAGAIEWEVLSELDHEILKELGVQAPGHRLRILKAVRELGANPSTDESGEAVAADSQRAEAERRQLTVMFCDLVGSTELSQRLDPEELRDLNRAYQDTCKAAIERYDGYVARYMGDGVLAYFGYPQAHEDDAERAIHAGLAIVSRAGGDKTAVRVGIATGPVVVGDLIGEGASQENAVVGETPNLAARLQALATPDTVVISPGTYALAQGRFEYEDLGVQELKGISQPVRAWHAIAPAAAESRFEAAHRAGVTPLVGRENEIGLLMERWGQATEGDGQVVSLCGEAGIGKSRVTETLRERTADDGPIRLRYQCSPYHSNSALYPFVQSLAYAAEFDTQDSDSVRLDKLESLLAQATSDPAAVLPFFAPLLSVTGDGRYEAPQITAEQHKAATLQALIDQMVGLSSHAPVLVMFEDCHWADPTSLEMLELIVERVQTLPIMVVLTFRPEFSAPWSNYTHVTALTLNRFTRSLVAAMINSVSAGKSLPDDVLEQIIEKTDGVPLFVEELTKTIHESGDLSAAAIPTTLHDSLMARLDRLGAVKEVAQTAAVIGREFNFDLLASVSSLSFSQLHDALNQLMDAELVYKRSRVHGDDYLFKHALVQDAAYESLLKSTRRQLHGRIADALESRFPEIVEAQPELLGVHCTEAGLTDRALTAWQQAAQRAMERSANKESMAYLYKALSLIVELPETPERQRRELTILVALAGPLITIRGYGDEETHKAFVRAQELSANVGATAELFPVLYGRWVYGLSRQTYHESYEVALQVSELATQQNETGPTLIGHRLLGLSLFIDGQPGEGQANFEKVVELYDADKHADLKYKFGQDPAAAAMAFSSLCLWQLGYPERGRAVLDRALAHAQTLDHLNTLAYVQIFGSATLHHVCFEPVALKTAVAGVKQLAEEHELELWKLLASLIENWMLAREHGDKAAVEHMSDLLEVSRKTFAFRLSYNLAMLAEACMAAGKVDSGLAAVEEAIAMAEAVAERFFLADYHRIKAELLLRSKARSSEAEGCLMEGLRIARAQQARSLELRVATSLAGLWGENGRRQDGVGLLKPVVDWFSEGFETPDLQRAVSLLDELA